MAARGAGVGFTTVLFSTLLFLTPMPGGATSGVTGEPGGPSEASLAKGDSQLMGPCTNCDPGGGGSTAPPLHETYARERIREDLTPYGVDFIGAMAKQRLKTAPHYCTFSAVWAKTTSIVLMAVATGKQLVVNAEGCEGNRRLVGWVRVYS